MKKTIISIFALVWLFWFTIWSCIQLSLNDGSKIMYCWPSECSGEYQAFWNDSQNNNLKQSYINCIIADDPDNSWQSEGTACLIDEQCGSNWMCVDSQENPGEKTCITKTKLDMWINMDTKCLINWQCSYNIYETLWIRKSDSDPSVTTFVQDIVLWVTMFIGTVVSVILVVSWILYIMAWIQGNSTLADTAKKWIINSLIWLLLVVASYSIVRLIQFLATAWGW